MQIERRILAERATMESNPLNLDRATVDDFGREWRRFDQSAVSGAELQRSFGEYFALFPWDSLPPMPWASMPVAEAGDGPGSSRRASAGCTASTQAPTH